MSVTTIRRLSVLMAMVMVAAAGPLAASVTETVEKSFPVADGARVSLDNVNGDVVVETWSSDEVWVQAVKTAATQERLDQLEVKIDATAERVRIDTDYPRSNRGWGHEGPTKVEYTLRVPAGALVDSIDLVNGDLRVSGLLRKLHAETVNGRIIATDVMGDITLETVNGTLEVELASLDVDDRVRLDSVNGDIELRIGSPASIDVDTVNGRLTNDVGLTVKKGKYVGAEMFGDLHGGGARVEIETVNGRVNISGS